MCGLEGPAQRPRRRRRSALLRAAPDGDVRAPAGHDLVRCEGVVPTHGRYNHRSRIPWDCGQAAEQEAADCQQAARWFVHSTADGSQRFLLPGWFFFGQGRVAQRGHSAATRRRASLSRSASRIRRIPVPSSSLCSRWRSTASSRTGSIAGRCCASADHGRFPPVGAEATTPRGSSRHRARGSRFCRSILAEAGEGHLRAAHAEAP